MKSEIKKWDIGKSNRKKVKEEFIKEVTANIQNTQLEVEDIIIGIKTKRKLMKQLEKEQENKKDYKEIVGWMKNVKYHLKIKKREITTQ